jgi:lipopolysaccharide export system protein LptA
MLIVPVPLLAAAANKPAAAPAPADSAQGGLMGQGHGPLDLSSENGIEWNREARTYTLTGKAQAIRADVTVNADKIVAKYREKKAADPNKAGNSEDATDDIYEIDAYGDVVIHSPTEIVVGEKAVYDLDKGLVVLTGSNLRLTTHSNQVVTARDSLEYYDQTKLAIARGNAVATQIDRRVSGDVLTAYIEQDPKTNESQINKVDAFGNVRVSTPTQVATGAKGVYNMRKNLATLVGNVHVTHGQNQLEGEYGEVDMNTGISRMLSGPAAGVAGARVHGLIIPKDAKEAAKAKQQQQPEN